MTLTNGVRSTVLASSDFCRNFGPSSKDFAAGWGEGARQGDAGNDFFV